MSNGLAHSEAPVRKAHTIQFGILSPEEIKAYSVCKVEYPETYEEGSQRPKPGGLSDPRMGTIDRNFKCATCGEGMADCPGHFGHIELSKAVFHVGFINKCKKITESICVLCGKLKSSPHLDPRLAEVVRFVRDPKKRLAIVHSLVKTKNVCEMDAAIDPSEPVPEGKEPVRGHGGCGHQQPQIRREGLKLIMVYSKGKDEDGNPMQPDRKPLTPTMANALFRKIPAEDLKVMGLNPLEAHPAWMILTVLPVPPPPVRPSIAVDGGAMRGEDDLTYKLAEIIRANQVLRKFEEEGAPNHVIAEFETLLQWHVATYMDNDIAGQPQAMQKSGRPVKSIRARLKGKEGRLRGNLMGKRVDFSARTVITGDPNLALDEVGVPFSIARNLTYPERVTPYNISYLQELVRNGPNEYPGARYIVRDTGDRIDLRYNKRADTALQFGWIVERHLKDGDLVLFNRQPSLHKMSMMAHRVKLMPFSTFRLNLSVTSPYNADFDGDEMNLHVPQSEETRAELMQICAVPRNIISPQANKPVMGIVQDTLCGVRKFTLRDCFMDRDFIQNILLWVPEWDGIIPPPAILKPKQLWTGKQILSMCIPKGINLYRAPDPASPNPVEDNGMWIEDGEIIYGIVDKKTVGASQGGIIHIIFREKGHEVCRDFFSGVQKVVNYWLLHNGFSIGIGDTVPDKGTMEAITGFIDAAKNQVAEIIQMAQEDKLEPEPGMSIRESFESKVNKALNSARDSSGRSAEKSLKGDNNVKQMVVAGSKGSFINISQMSACVGQQIVEGKRVPFGFKHRTLPHFTKDDYSPEARGFVENSYLRGLTPQEFFFHAMAGREGLIDTAVKTAETGYIQRRLVKALEDVMVAYDGTVRNSLGDVVQFVYGEDGMDGAFIEEQVIDPIRLSDERFEKRYRLDVMDRKWTFRSGALQVGLIDQDDYEQVQALLDDEYEQLKEDRKMLREFIFPNGDATVFLPVNVRRTIQNAQQIFHIDFRKPSDLHPEVILRDVAALLERLVVVRGSGRLVEEAQANATLLFNIFLRSNFAVRRVIEEHHLNQEAFQWVLGEVESKFKASLAAPGEMCGTLAAQSIGEPATQMTLNTFHYAGVSSKNVTLGVPRLKEIINVAVNLKTPSMTVYLQPEIARDIDLAKEVQTMLSYTTLKTITASTEIIYDPEVNTTVITDDIEFVEAFFAIPDEDVEANLHRQSPWLLRFELDRAKMLDKKLEMSFVAGKIAEVFEQDLFVIWSEDNAEKLVIRCRALNEEGRDKEDGAEEAEDAEEDIFLKQLEASMLSTISLRGVEGIERVFMLQHKRNVITESGEFDNPTEWVLETDGINLRKVLCVDGVDPTRTVSNSCVEVLQVLGIEAARASVLRELRNVIEFDGSRVNYRHLSMLTDIMTNRGSLMAITRHGINRSDTGALMRCSFEETVEILFEAAATGEIDYCTGVAENILLGQVAPMGTGAFELSLDMEMLKEVVIDHRLPMAGMNAYGNDGGLTPGGGGMTPYADANDSRTPMHVPMDGLANFSPLYDSSAGYDQGGGLTPIYGGASPAYGGASPFGGGASPGYSPSSPFPGYSPVSPGYNPRSPGGALGGRSPAGYAPQSPWVDRLAGGGATSPSYSPTSPMINMSPASPRFSPASPAWSPSSPSFSPASPSFSPASPSFSPSSPSFSPASPRYSPTSPSFSPSSPKYSPTSPQYSPVRFLRSRDLSSLLPNEPDLFPSFASLQSHEPQVFADVAAVFADVTAIQPYLPILQPHLPGCCAPRQRRRRIELVQRQRERLGVALFKQVELATMIVGISFRLLRSPFAPPLLSPHRLARLDGCGKKLAAPPPSSSSEYLVLVLQCPLLM
ncbi:BQ5605_C007g04513 [Microbotryum silenes-dioicae]|uniref:DNA-directed RNA polymerase subunit n=3 Tax=Microbotryum TaxID=34416 RepID=A0A2X0P9D1_9BASI|nr:BQ5605_C007g04513 [Microbotryum silenes-dioicae]